eukprot:SM002159S06613  [mRNA]  locus=s2159:27:440:+ [translate_table: standard]
MAPPGRGRCRRPRPPAARPTLAAALEAAAQTGGDPRSATTTGAGQMMALPSSSGGSGDARSATLASGLLGAAARRGLVRLRQTVGLPHRHCRPRRPRRRRLRHRQRGTRRCRQLLLMLHREIITRLRRPLPMVALHSP